MKTLRQRIVDILDQHKVSKHEILDMSELSEMHEGKCASVNCRDEWERPECNCKREEKIDKLVKLALSLKDDHRQEGQGSG